MSTQITRRELISRGGLALGASVLAEPVWGDPRPRAQAGGAKRVVIIGAGLAGLSAGFELQKTGHEITILEARDRPGGRVLTLREPFSDGLYAEAGALFIPDNHDLTLKYVKLFSLPLVEVFGRGEAEMYFVRGRRIKARQDQRVEWPYKLSPEERDIGLPGMWDKYIGFALKELGDPTSPGWPRESLRKLDSVTIGDLMRSKGASEAAVDLLRLGYIDLWGDGVEACSALSVLRDLLLREGEKANYAIKGGNDQLPKAFAAKLKESIRYSSPVTRIERGDRSISVVYRASDGEKKIEADRVIAAIPFTTLRRITVTPPFSTAKRAAIDQLLYTSVARVYLQSKRRFWKERGLPGATSTDLPLQWIFEPTEMQPGPRGILEAYMAGPVARRVTSMKEANRIAFTLEHMEKIHPGIRDNFERGATKCWDEDEWSRGDYCWFRPGQLTALLPDIIRTEDRIHFAGEHASPWPGWMQGALHAGIRTAREIAVAAA